MWCKLCCKKIKLSIDVTVCFPGVSSSGLKCYVMIIFDLLAFVTVIAPWWSSSNAKYAKLNPTWYACGLSVLMGVLLSGLENLHPWHLCYHTSVKRALYGFQNFGIVSVSVIAVVRNLFSRVMVFVSHRAVFEISWNHP